MAGKRRLDIEALLTWTYRDQQAHRAGADTSARLAAACGDSCVAVARNGVLAAGAPRRHGGGGVYAGTFGLHPDAELVAGMVEAMPGPDQSRVIHHALRAERPDWWPEAWPRWRPLHWRRRPSPASPGEAVIGIVAQYAVVTWRNAWVGGAIQRLRTETKIVETWCPIHLDDPPAEILSVYGDYRAWWRAVAEIARRLATVALRDHEVGEFRAPPCPWGPAREAALRAMVENARQPVPQAIRRQTVDPPRKRA